MRISCAMMALRVTPLAEEGAEVDGVEEAEGVVVLVHGCLDRSWASLHLMVATSMAHMIEKLGDAG